MCTITRFFCLFNRAGNFSLENAVQRSWNLPDLCPKSMGFCLIYRYVHCLPQVYLPYRRDLNAASIVQSCSLLKRAHSHRDCWVVCFPVIPKGYKKIIKSLNCLSPKQSWILVRISLGWESQGNCVIADHSESSALKSIFRLQWNRI